MQLPRSLKSGRGSEHQLPHLYSQGFGTVVVVTQTELLVVPVAAGRVVVEGGVTTTGSELGTEDTRADEAGAEETEADEAGVEEATGADEAGAEEAGTEDEGAAELDKAEPG